MKHVAPATSERRSKNMHTIRKLILGIIAIGSLATATPALAFHHHYWHGRVVYVYRPYPHRVVLYDEPYYYGPYYRPYYGVTFAFGGHRYYHHHRHWW
jgi:hypothetical protein